MSIINVLNIKNGNLIYKYYIYRCDRCGAIVECAWPHYQMNEKTYCWDCSFIEGLISDKEWMQYCCRGNIDRAVVKDGKIYALEEHHKFPWEMTDKDYRATKQYREWREKVFKRDNFTCQRCGQHGGFLEAHHIKRFKLYPALRYLLNNGITLCQGCHRIVHKTKDKKYLKGRLKNELHKN